MLQSLALQTPGSSFVDCEQEISSNKGTINASKMGRGKPKYFKFGKHYGNQAT